MSRIKKMQQTPKHLSPASKLETLIINDFDDGTAYYNTLRSLPERSFELADPCMIPGWQPSFVFFALAAQSGLSLCFSTSYMNANGKAYCLSNCSGNML